VIEYTEVNPATVEVLSTKTLGMIKEVEEIVMIPSEDERISRWAMYLDDLGIKAELLI
jgi:hypothetical protein|tara:strand:- start:102 stop:275 length:174 start_codon:yes stop_codon:yes gene_type:complete